MISLALFALGGEGRFFYANSDWQVRDAVLHDMATNVWPFAYDLHGTAYFVRAPLGTYLLPAMFGTRCELVLLISNSLRLALVLTLAWHLFKSKRERAITLAVFILFSGWDVVGTAIYSALGAHLSWINIERRNFSYQYSSHVTQAFWVPQHAIAGWACALAFLLWRKGLVPIGFFAAMIPLVAIWSPLAIIGAIPFAILAGFEVLRRRSLDRKDASRRSRCSPSRLPFLPSSTFRSMRQRSESTFADRSSLGMALLRGSGGLAICLSASSGPRLPEGRPPKSFSSSSSSSSRCRWCWWE